MPPTKTSGFTGAEIYHAYLDKVEPRLAEGIVGFWLGRATELGEDRLALAFSGMLPIDLRQKVREDVAEFLLEELVPAWRAAYEHAGGTSPERYLMERVTTLQEPLTRDMIDALESAGAVLAAAHGDESDPAMLASLYGLTSADALAVARYEARLVSKSLWRRAREYARQQLRNRARRLAMFEVAHAYHGGQDDVARRVLGPGNYVNVWLVDPLSNVCKRCAGMQGETRDPGRFFSEGVETPPLHSECRCRVEKRLKTP